MSRKKVVIIGAGIGGLGTANLLAKAGYEVTVLEKNAQPGGRAGVLEANGFRFDTGPSWYLMPEVFEHYFSLLDTTTAAQLDIVQLRPAYKVFFEHAAPLTITTDRAQDEATFEAIEPGAGKALRQYALQSDHTYALALKHFLYTNFTSLRDVLRWDIMRHTRRLLMLAFMPIDRYIQRFVRDQRLKQVLEYTMVFLGASPYEAPALYSLMSAIDFKHGVFYPRGGMYGIIERLVAIGTELGVQYRYHADVRQISVQDGRATGVVLADGHTVPADIVVSGADTHFTETALLAPPYQTYPAAYWQRRNAGPSALLMYLGIKGPLPELAHHSLFFVDAWKENFEAIYGTHAIPHPASLYVSRATATDPQLAPPGHETIVVLVPFPSGVDIAQDEQKRLADEYIQQLARMSGIADFADRIVQRHVVGPNDFAQQYNAWRSTALGPAHTLRQSAMFRTRNRSKKVSNLYYVGGATIPGIGLPMCLIGAELVYKHLAGQRRGGPVARIEHIGGDA